MRPCSGPRDRPWRSSSSSARACSHRLGLEDRDERIERRVQLRDALERLGDILRRQGPVPGTRCPPFVISTPSVASSCSSIGRSDRYASLQKITSNGPASLYSIRRGSPPITVARVAKPSLDKRLRVSAARAASLPSRSACRLVRALHPATTCAASSSEQRRRRARALRLPADIFCTC